MRGETSNRSIDSIAAPLIAKKNAFKVVSRYRSLKSSTMKSFEQQVTDVRCTLPSMARLRCDVMLNFPRGLKLLSCKMKCEAVTPTPNFTPAMSRCDRAPFQGPTVHTEESSRLSDRPKDMEDSQNQHNELSFKPQTSCYLLCKSLHHSAYEVHVH